MAGAIAGNAEEITELKGEIALRSVRSAGLRNKWSACRNFSRKFIAEALQNFLAQVLQNFI